VGGIENLLKQIPLKLLLFGSNAPLFYFESSALKFIESALPAEEKRFITGENARRLMAK